MNQIFKNIFSLNSKYRMFSSMHTFAEEYTVNQFCKLHINFPFNVKIRPLDLHKHPNNDKLFIKLITSNPKNEISFDCKQKQENIYITSSNNKTQDVKCYIEAPIVADLFVTTTNRGNIDIKTFKGDKLILNSETGDIVTENCHNTIAKYISKAGNIITNGSLHASDISMETKESGCIIANHLQALTSSVKTVDGDVRTKCCYCDQSHFETETGKLILNNVHKKCTVNIHDCGILQMVGFDGVLNANIREGEADIQLTKLYEESNISISVKSPTLIRLAETIMDNTKIEANCASIAISESIQMKQKVDKNNCYLLPTVAQHSKLNINCPTSHLVVEEASWADMIALQKRNF